MGTRSLTHVLNADGTPLVTIYRQMDGYPSVHGAELDEFLRGRVLVNGISSDTPEKASNGMGCLAASLVAALKDGIGSIYLEPSGSTDYGEEFIYTITPALSPDAWTGRTGDIRLKVEDVVGGHVLYDGPTDGFDPLAYEGEAS